VRIRSLKPEFWTDKKVASWPIFTRLLFTGLWSAADDYGCGSAEPAIIAASLFPYDMAIDPAETMAQVAASISRIATDGRIRLYAVGDETFFEVVNWNRHQKVDRPSKSRIPKPDDGVPVPPQRPLQKAKEKAAPLAHSPVQEPLAPIEEATDPAREILAHLNAKASRQFRPTPQNLATITARLSDVGGDAAGIKTMIDRQCANWLGNPQMEEYLRPETLFGKTKFQGYYDDRNRPPASRTGTSQPHRTGDVRNDGIAGLQQWTAERDARIASEDPSAAPPGN
jgi:uncharacterized phage protein (TIGR02220 family)